MAKDTTTTLASTRRALDVLVEEGAGLSAARDKALLDGASAAEISRIDKQIEVNSHAAATEKDRIRLLERKLVDEEAEAAKRRHEEHVQEFERTLAAADVKGDELQAATAVLEETFREVIRLREAAFALWPHGRSSHGDALVHSPDGAALTANAIKVLLQHEIHRVGSSERLGGDPNEQTKIALPGGISPRLTPLVDPKTKRPVPLKSLGEVLRNASRFAVETLRHDLFVPAVTPQPEPKGPRLVFDERAVAPVQQQQQVIKPAAPAPAQPQPPAAGDVDPLREYIPPIYRERLAALLRQQMQAAASGDDQLYEKSVSNMIALRSEIDAAKQQGEDAA